MRGSQSSIAIAEPHERASQRVARGSRALAIRGGSARGSLATREVARDLLEAPAVTRARLLLLAAGCTALVAGGATLAHRARVRAQRAAPAQTQTSEEPRVASGPAHARATRSPPMRRSELPAIAPPPPSVDRLTLRTALLSNDPAVRIGAVEDAVRTTSIETLDVLEHVELAKDPEAAPTVIHAVALLGASADGAARDEAAATLARWLGEEKQRDGVDALGNVSNLVEALGEVGGRDAVDALAATLVRGDVGLEVQTLAVQQLGELGDPRARPAVETFATRAAAMPPAEGIDEELRVEAIAAAKETLARI